MHGMHQLMLILVTCVLINLSASARTMQRNDSLPGYVDPHLLGGSMMTITKDTTPAGLGEPVNVIVSGNSDSRVLEDDMLNGGIYNFLAGLGFGGQCLGLSMGNLRGLDTGDGRGIQDQEVILRHNYGDPYFGGCAESIRGGSHVRVWHQITTRAWFWSVSLEKDMKANHDIIADGYDDGRDYVVALAIGKPELNLDLFVPIEGDVFTGKIQQRGWTYETRVAYEKGVVSQNKSLYNHYSTVQMIGRPVVDGLVAVLTVQVSAASRTRQVQRLAYVVCSCALALWTVVM